MISVSIRDIKAVINKASIMTPAERAQKKLLDGFGFYCRKVMMNSIKMAPSPSDASPPGSPPYYHYHAGRRRIFKDTIFFVTDVPTKTTTIGAVLMDGTAANGQPVPGILEKGGVVEVQKEIRDRLGNVSMVRVPRTILARPYAKPAFDLTIKKKLPDLIAGGIMREAT